MLHCHGYGRNALTYYRVHVTQRYCVQLESLPLVEQLARLVARLCAPCMGACICRLSCVFVGVAGANFWRRLGAMGCTFQGRR